MKPSNKTIKKCLNTQIHQTNKIRITEYTILLLIKYLKFNHVRKQRAILEIFVRNITSDINKTVQLDCIKT